MSSVDPKNLMRPVVTRNSSWLDLCMRAWGAEFNMPDHGVYVFSNGVKKDSTDKYLTGIYGVEVDEPLWADDNYPDMRSVIFQNPSGDEISVE